MSRFVEVKGASIHYRQWESHQSESPGIVLVHGAGAHSHWWDWIAPELLDSYAVVALDCSGAGDSDHKAVYPAGDSAAEITAVCRAAGFDGDVFLVGHSFGFMLALLAALRSPGHYRGLVGIEPPGGGKPPAEEKPRDRVRKEFATRADAIENFRLSHPVHNDYLAEYVTAKSVKETERGWTWKADPNWRQRSTPDGIVEVEPDQLTRTMECPLAFLLGKKSAYFNAPMLAQYQSVVGAENVVMIEDAGHHAHLDQPLVVARELRGILARW